MNTIKKISGSMGKPTFAAFVLLIVSIIPCCSKSPGKNESITISNLHLEGMSLIYIARDQDIFKQSGLNVTITNFDTGPQAIQELLDGKSDVATSMEYPLVGMALNKQKIKAIGCIVKSEFTYLVARKDRGIQNASDLKGKRIGLIRGTLIEFYLGRFLTLHSLNMSDVTIVDMKMQRLVDALLKGEVDAIIYWQPYLNLAEGRLGKNTIQWQVQSTQMAYGLLVCRADWITKNPDSVSKILAALRSAESYIVFHPAEAKSIVRKEFNFDKAYAETVWSENQFALSFDQSLVTALEDEARWMIANKLTRETNVPDFIDYIYEDALKTIAPSGVHIIR